MIGNFSQLWRITRELDLNAIRDDFERRGTLLVAGSNQALAERVARLLAPTSDLHDVHVGVLGEPGLLSRRVPVDAAVVALGGPLDASARRDLSELGLAHAPLLVLRWSTAPDVVVLGVPEGHNVLLEPDATDEEVLTRLAGALVEIAPEAMLPLARHHPQLRAPVAARLIQDAARANAQFAALSSLPATLPLIGGAVGDMADILVLTKNQVVLLFKLAGLYGRDLRYGRRLLAEVLPVVGGAFLWRSTARMLVGLLPTVVSLLPKAVVAYTGTVVVGELARYYYEHGRKPPPQIARQIVVDAQALATGMVHALPFGRHEQKELPPPGE